VSKELKDYLLFIVCNNPKGFLIHITFKEVFLHIIKRIVLVIGYFDQHFIPIIAIGNEPVIEEESGIAFLAVAIIELFPSFNCVYGFDDEAFDVLVVGPTCLLWPPMIQHISQRHEGICFLLIDFQTKDPA